MKQEPVGFIELMKRFQTEEQSRESLFNSMLFRSQTCPGHRGISPYRLAHAAEAQDSDGGQRRLISAFADSGDIWRVLWSPRRRRQTRRGTDKTPASSPFRLMPRAVRSVPGLFRIKNSRSHNQTTQLLSGLRYLVHIGKALHYRDH